MECPLLLTTLSGVTFKVSLSVAKFDRFTDLEDQVMDYLASVTDLQVFGCVIDFLHNTTQTYLEDPIWDKLQQGGEYTIVFRDCSVPCENKNSSVVVLLIKSPCCSCPNELRRNCPRMGLCRCATPATR